MEWHSDKKPTPFLPPLSPSSPYLLKLAQKNQLEAISQIPEEVAPAPTPQEVIHALKRNEAYWKTRYLEDPTEFHFFPYFPQDIRFKILRLASPPPSTLVIEYAVTIRRGEEAERRFKNSDRPNEASARLLHVCRESRDLMLRDGWGWVYLQDREEDRRLFNFEEALMVWTMSARVENSSVELVGSQALATLAPPQDTPVGPIMADRVRNLGICEELWFVGNPGPMEHEMKKY